MCIYMLSMQQLRYSLPLWLQESTVVPLLMQGLQALCKERPDNPVEYLANYMLQHNPQKQQAVAAPAGVSPASLPSVATAAPNT